jgi:hypothetical protein
MRDLLEQLFRWWQAPEASAPPAFAEEFEFIGATSVVDTDLWRASIERGAPPEQVKLLGMLGEGSLGFIAFEATDPITLLRHRNAWLVEAKDGRIVRLTDINQIVEH